MPGDVLRKLMFSCLLCFAALVSAQTSQRTAAQADILRGAYGPYRANNDLLSYHLDIRVDPEKKFISGRNTIRFRMLKDNSRVQLDLTANLKVDKILLGSAELKYSREFNAVFIDFPETLKKNSTYSIEFFYSGVPGETGRFGGITFRKDPAGPPLDYHGMSGAGRHGLVAEQGAAAR